MAPNPNEILSRLLGTWNSAGFQSKDPALYQTVKTLIESSRQIIENAATSLSDLNTNLSNSFTFGTASDRATYQPQSTVSSITFFYETDTGKLYIYNNGQQVWSSASGAPSTATYLTATNQAATLPNSRQLLAGTNVTFNDAVANQRTINVASSSSDPIPLDFLFLGA